MRVKKIFILGLILGLTLLNGCTYLQRPSAPKYTSLHISWKKRQAELQRMDHWTMEGALSITQGKKREIARFKWIQKPQDYVITISGPLNLQSMRLVGNPHGVELWRTHQECLRANTPEQLILTHLGWQLPVSNLRYWIRSLPAPKAKIKAIKFDQYEHLISLQQSGWYIKYSEFQLLATKNLDVPKVVELANQDLTIKVKITHLDPI